MGETRSLSLFFVADGARLEHQSWLLAASLYRAHRDDDRVRLVAYVGASHHPKLRAATRALYEACGVELRLLPDPPRWKSPYPHGNKIVAACDDRGSSQSIFLDTDMLCTGSLTEFLDLKSGQCAAAPEGRPTWGAENDRWRRAYAHFGMEVPTERVRLLRGRRPDFVPYFNAGFVAFSESPHAEDGKRLPEHWLETALEFDFHCAIANKRPWLDQISLPLTLKRFGYGIRVLDERYNYSLSHRADYARTPDAKILHYHRYYFLTQTPQWPGFLASMFDTIPASIHNSLHSHIAEIEATPAP